MLILGFVLITLLLYKMCAIAKESDQKMKQIIENADRCVCCGCIVPEGRMVCWACENEVEEAAWEKEMQNLND